MSKKQLIIHPLTFIPDLPIGLEIFSWDERKRSFAKILNADESLSQETQNQLAMQAEPNCYILAESLGAYRKILANNLNYVANANPLPEIIKLSIICEFMRFHLSDALDSRSFERWIESAYSCAKDFDHRVKTATLGQAKAWGQKVLFALWKEGTFLNHSFNVGFYCYLLAKCLPKKLSEELDPVECMVSGFLHDVGKLCGDDESEDSGTELTAPVGRLLSNPIKEYDSHPSVGFKLLMKNPTITKLPLLACYQHHERHNGKGYPVGLYSEEIPIGSSICAVANRWDGLLTDRQGSKAISRVNAIQTIQSEKSLYWNAEVVQCLSKLMC
jgi:HD-GYP domain-containing protein (c-di-GMP phosphodiesterase class II)